jgi:hypothetical protein
LATTTIPFPTIASSALIKWSLNSESVKMESEWAPDQPVKKVRIILVSFPGTRLGCSHLLMHSLLQNVNHKDLIPTPEQEERSPSILSSPSLSINPTKKIFSRVWDPERDDWVFNVNESMATNKRKEQSCLMNVEVQQTHLLSSAQLEAAGLFEPQPNRLTWLNTESGGLPGFGEVTADKLQEWGFLDRLLVIREKLLYKDYQPMLADICRRANSKYEEQSGTTYQAGVTIQPHFGPSSCQLGPISRAEDELE